MSADRITALSRRTLLVATTVGLLIAGTVAATGIVSRNDTYQHLVQWTNQQAIPTVQLAKLDTGSGEQSLMLPGNIQPFYRAPIYARVSGYLKSWQYDIGGKVKAGDVLATIDTPELDHQLSQAKADLATATANAQLASITASRWNVLVKSQWVSRQASDDKTGAANAAQATMEAATANLNRIGAMVSFKSLVAPFDGIVTARNTDIGALINVGSANGQALFEVSDMHRVRIYVQVPQVFSGQIRPGLKANFEMPQYPGQQFGATLVTISHSMDPTSRSMLAELQTDNADGKFFGGAYCQVSFILPTPPNVVQVPATALVPTNKGMDVAVLGSDNKVTMKPIQIGREMGSSVEVVAGIVRSDKVIDSPPETLQTGDEVQLAQDNRSVSANVAAN